MEGNPSMIKSKQAHLIAKQWEDVVHEIVGVAANRIPPNTFQISIVGNNIMAIARLRVPAV
jgi:hypothetical protein